ncbi:hypothetical protein EIP86_007842 [Pleurotus ostreatoroseus]|nr:hypothetical protein EIP86_007842 [Pleurotus ostreatoroseus]
MDGDSETTSRALLQELLVAQRALLQEVRESKERISALSTRLERLEENTTTSGVGRLEATLSDISVRGSTKNAVKEEQRIRDLGHARSSTRVPPSDIDNSALADVVVPACAAYMCSANGSDPISKKSVKASKYLSFAPESSLVADESSNSAIQDTDIYEVPATPCRKPRKRSAESTKSVYDDRIDLTSSLPEFSVRAGKKSPGRSVISSSSTQTQLLKSSTSVPTTPPTSIKTDQTTPHKKLKRPAESTASSLAAKRNCIDLTTPPPESSIGLKSESPEKFVVSSTDTQPRSVDSKTPVPPPPICIQHEPTTPRRNIPGPVQPMIEAVKASLGLTDLETPLSEPSVHTKVESPQRSLAPPAVSGSGRVGSEAPVFALSSSIKAEKMVPHKRFTKSTESVEKIVGAWRSCIDLTIPHPEDPVPTDPIKSENAEGSAASFINTTIGQVGLRTPVQTSSAILKIEPTTPPNPGSSHPVMADSPSIRGKLQAKSDDDPDILDVQPATLLGIKRKSPDSGPISSAVPRKKRRKLVMEVCIRTDKSARRRLALAGSFEDVVQALQRNAERRKRLLEKQVDYWDEGPEPQSPQIKRMKREREPKHDDSSDSKRAGPSNLEHENLASAKSFSSPLAVNVKSCRPEPSVPNIKPKVDAKDLKPDIGRRLFDDDSIRRRLTSYADFPVDLSSPMRNVLVTRAFMSTTFGGSPMEFYPKISPEKRLALGGHNHHFLFPHLGHNPHAPQRPGQVGLLCRSGDEAPWGTRVMKLVVRIRDGMWWYMGEYQTVRSEPLSQAEFAKLGRTTKWAWASTVRKRKKQHDVEIRARVILRRKLGREPTVEDLHQAFAMETRFSDVTEDEIIQSYEDGLEVVISLFPQGSTH